ncbi:MAG: DUF4340 domain-containing protein [Cyanobacteria bacterium J06635_1]
MKLQRSTWVLLVVAIALGSGVLLYETQTVNDTEQTQGQSLYPFEEKDVQQLKIDRADTIIAFEKTSDGTWGMSEPQQQPAEAGAIAFLLDQLTGKPTLDTLTVSPDDLPKFGLDAPPATVTLTLADSVTHQIQVGSADFSGDNLYVRRVDEAEEDDGEAVTVYLVSGGLRNGVERPVEEWLIADESAEAEAAEPGEGAGVEEDGDDEEVGGAEASEPEASEPEASEPETTDPETTEPEAPEPEASEPEASEPGDAAPPTDASTSEN